MSAPFIGEIRLFGFPRIPMGWLACNGAALPIQAFDTLYQLIGTTFGGDGVNTFNLPDLRGRVPLSQGTGPGGLTPRIIGQAAGEEDHTLIAAEMAQHSHYVLAIALTGSTSTPGPAVQLGTATDPATKLYAPAAAFAYTGMAQSLDYAGNGNSHTNMMPTLTCNYCICIDGVFPPQS